MYAMILDEKLNFKWQEMPDPVPGAGEVLIKVCAASINRADLMQKDGCYASPPDWPQWCGLEVSGIVLSAPPGCHVKAGDKVCALLGGGGYSELVTAPAGMVIPIPEGLSMVEAASLPEVWATVYLNLQQEAGDPTDRTVLEIAMSTTPEMGEAIRILRECEARGDNSSDEYAAAMDTFISHSIYCSMTNPTPKCQVLYSERHL